MVVKVRFLSFQSLNKIMMMGVLNFKKTILYFFSKRFKVNSPCKIYHLYILLFLVKLLVHFFETKPSKMFNSKAFETFFCQKIKSIFFCLCVMY